MPAAHDLKLYSGDTTVFVLQWLGDDGLPIDISSAAIRLAAKKAISDPAPFILANAQIVNGPLGKFAIVFPSEATHNIGQHELVYDLQATFSNGFVRTLFRGIFNIEREVY